jgi:hypothetical protein
MTSEDVTPNPKLLVGNVMVDSLLFNLEIPNYRCLALTLTDRLPRRASSPSPNDGDFPFHLF